jgi:penicillin-binding protein 2
MTLTNINQYGPGFQVKVLAALLGHKEFLTNIHDIISEEYFESQAHKWIIKEILKYYDKYHGAGKWNPISIISLAIGQGEMGVTPLQMANFCAVIANRGWFYPPHLIKSVDGGKIKKEYLNRRKTAISSRYFDLVVDGMRNVVLNGTGKIAQLDSLTICGKTGTAQNPHGKDHSIFIAFAPMDNPKIAMAVYVENAGYGATWAAPIASLMIEKYLRREVKRPEMEKKIMEANLLPRKEDKVDKK